MELKWEKLKKYKYKYDIGERKNILNFYLYFVHFQH